MVKNNRRAQSAQGRNRARLLTSRLPVPIKALSSSTGPLALLSAAPGDSGRSRTHQSTDTPTRSREMSAYVCSESRRVCPSVRGNRFDTAHRKRAVANIFENVNQDALTRLFQKTGDVKAEERVRSIFSFAQDPEETARALMALKQRKKDKFLQIAGAVRQLLKLR